MKPASHAITPAATMPRSSLCAPCSEALAAFVSYDVAPAAGGAGAAGGGAEGGVAELSG